MPAAGGVPLMTGGRLATAAAATTIVNGASDACAAPSDTVIETFGYEPTFAAAGVPLKRPVEVLKLAHDGRLAIENVSACPSGSEAVGVKL